MSKEITQKIQRLNKKLKSLQQEKDSSDKIVAQWAEKRDQINKQLKDLRLQTRKTREQRDTLNKHVKTLKTQRDETRNVIKKKIKEIKQLKTKLQLLITKKPNIDTITLRKEKEDIEWKIQTSSLTLQEEKSFVEKANQLGVKLEIHKKIINLQNHRKELQVEIDKMNKKADQLHKSLEEKANQSQELHEIMIENLENIKDLQSEADGYHKEFLQNKEKSWKLHQEVIEVINQIRSLKKDLLEITDQKKKKQQEEKREKLKKETLEKLEKGRKLSLDEFKILAEEEST